MLRLLPEDFMSLKVASSLASGFGHTPPAALAFKADLPQDVPFCSAEAI